MERIDTFPTTSVDHLVIHTLTLIIWGALDTRLRGTISNEYALKTENDTLISNTVITASESKYTIQTCKHISLFTGSHSLRTFDIRSITTRPLRVSPYLSFDY